jgi:tetratricopeptide (TPR) repeat protein
MGTYDDSVEAFRRGMTGRAEELAVELLNQARESGDVGGQVDGLCMLARVALRRADLARVSALAGEARSLGRRAGEPRLERMPLHLQAVAVRMQGAYSEARLLYQESIELNVQLGEERMVAVEHRNLAYVELHDGHPDRARELFKTAADEARALGYNTLEPYLLLDAAVLAFEAGARDRARQLVEATQAAFAAVDQILDPDDAAEEEWLRSVLLVSG